MVHMSGVVKNKIETSLNKDHYNNMSIFYLLFPPFLADSETLKSRHLSVVATSGAF